MDGWKEIRRLRLEKGSIKEWLVKRREIRKKRRTLSCEEMDLGDPAVYVRPTFSEDDPTQLQVEKHLFEYLLSPMLNLPVEVAHIDLHLEGVCSHSVGLALRDVVDRLFCQGMVEVILRLPNSFTIVNVHLDPLSKLAEINGVVKNKNILQENVFSDREELDYLLSVKSVREMESNQMGSDIQDLLNAKSVMEQLKLQNFKSAGGSKLREFCSYKTKEDCNRAKDTKRACPKLHFHRIVHPHTDQNLGDCSFLNTCFHMETCKFVHYSIDDSIDEPEAMPRPLVAEKSSLPRTKLTPPQWINCDMRYFDMSVIGKFSVIMADPPWDIHMELPYGTMGDDEMRQLNIPALQDEGYIFLWVTGRAMELGRECLTLWGYERVDELIWVKTNQLQRLIRTGRTGHWINHGKEHCLVGAKGNPSVNKGVDTDVIVAEVRATSHKPDEIYGVIERLSPGTRKVELFGRMHNAQPNWMTLGNQLDGIKILDPDIEASFYKRYPLGETDTMKVPTMPAGPKHM